MVEAKKEIKDETTSTEKNQQDLNEEKVWYSWQAPVRAFRRQDTQFWTTILSILALVAIIFFFAKDFLVIIPAASAIFLYYVLSSVPPETGENKITNRGVYFGPNFFPWSQISHFWLNKTGDDHALYLETFSPNLFNRQVVLLVPSSEVDQIKELCLRNIPLVENPPRFIDRFTESLGKLLPFEDKESKPTHKS